MPRIDELPVITADDLSAHDRSDLTFLVIEAPFLRDLQKIPLSDIVAVVQAIRRESSDA